MAEYRDRYKLRLFREDATLAPKACYDKSIARHRAEHLYPSYATNMLHFSFISMLFRYSAVPCEQWSSFNNINYRLGMPYATIGEVRIILLGCFSFTLGYPVSSIHCWCSGHLLAVVTLLRCVCITSVINTGVLSSISLAEYVPCYSE